MWVRHPYVQKKGKRAQVRAQVYVDPYRRPDAKKAKDRHIKSIPDRLHFRVAVAKDKYAKPRKPRPVNVLPPSALLADVDVARKVSERGIVDLKFTLGKKASKKLLNRTHAQRQVSTNVQVSHWKDSFAAKKHTPKWGYKQLNDAALQKKRVSKKYRKAYLRLAKNQVKTDRRMINVVPADQKRVQAAWAGASPMYNYAYVTNSTPFTQQIQLNPNIQCMWSGGPLNPPAAVDTIAPGGTIQTTYVLEPNPYVFGGNTQEAGGVWAALNGATYGMNAPGTQVEATKNLVDAATDAGQSLIDDAEDGANYNEEGAVAAVGAAVVTFLIDALEGASSGTCTDVATYPETFAVTSTVMGFGTDNDRQAWTADYANYPPGTWTTTQPIAAPGDTQYWVDGPTPDPGPTTTDSCIGTNGTTADGQTCYWTGTTVVGSQTSDTAVSTCAAPPVSDPSPWCTFVYETLQPMLGAQTSATYYWNGGQPAYMVSNNASQGSYAGGSAAFTGGLFQAVGPNPGLPGDAWCFATNTGVSNCSYQNYGAQSINAPVQNYNPMGAMNVQLTYLSSPQFQSGLWSGGPVKVTTSASDGNLSVTCDVSDTDVTLSTPFGPSGTSSINAANLANAQTVINSDGDQPSNAQWAVNFYGVDSNGEFVYFNPNMGTATAVDDQKFELAPNAGQTAIDFNADDAAQSYQGTVYAADLTNMQTVKDIAAGNTDVATLAAVGCSVVPQVDLAGLDVTGTVNTVPGSFGQILGNNKGWPMPGDHTGWPTNLYSPYDQYTNYSWQWPVTNINVSFQGVTEVAASDVNCTTKRCS